VPHLAEGCSGGAAAGSDGLCRRREKLPPQRPGDLRRHRRIKDETEGGLRAILNFGHTIGHAIENSVGYGKFLHGEAIAIGQVAAAKLSQKILGLPQRDVERIENLFQRAGLPVQIRLNSVQRKKLFTAMMLDKKVSGGEIKFVLAKKIGKVVWGQKVSTALIEEALAG